MIMIKIIKIIIVIIIIIIIILLVLLSIFFHYYDITIGPIRSRPILTEKVLSILKLRRGMLANV